MEDGLWTGKNMKEQNKTKIRSSKTIDIVSYALTVNGVKYVFVAHFRSSGTISKFIN